MLGVELGATDIADRPDRADLQLASERELGGKGKGGEGGWTMVLVR